MKWLFYFSSPMRAYVFFNGWNIYIKKKRKTNFMAWMMSSEPMGIYDHFPFGQRLHCQSLEILFLFFARKFFFLLLFLFSVCAERVKSIIMASVSCASASLLIKIISLFFGKLCTIQLKLNWLWVYNGNNNNNDLLMTVSQMWHVVRKLIYSPYVHK